MVDKVRDNGDYPCGQLSPLHERLDDAWKRFSTARASQQMDIGREVAKCLREVKHSLSVPFCAAFDGALLSLTPCGSQFVSLRADACQSVRKQLIGIAPLTCTTLEDEINQRLQAAARLS